MSPFSLRSNPIKSNGIGLYDLPFRGGNWDNGSNAGVFAVNLNDPRSNSNHNAGFRSALLLQLGI